MATLEPTREDGYAQSASTAPLAMQPGETIMGKFKIVELIGQGGMGSVYRVEDVFLGREFAFKCLNKQQANDVSWRRFQNEAKAASKLDHPNLIKVHDFDLMPDGRPFILMDLVKGSTLSDLTKNIGSMPVQRAIDIMIQVAFAIQYAHDQGIIHRDLKPTNIMVVPPDAAGEKEGVKLVDFGIAKLTGIDEFNQQTLTKTGEIFGSPLYMSPEQCTGTMVDHRSDLYSIGCVFYELLTGAPPFIGENALSTMMKHQGEMPLSLKEASLGSTFPPALEQIVAKLLEKDPNRRYQNGNALVVDLLPLTQDSNYPNAIPLPKIIPARQGQTTQFLVPDGNSGKGIDKTKVIAAVAGTAVACFAAGFATCYYFVLPNAEKQAVDDASKQIAQMPASKPVEPFLERKGNKTFFHFPVGVSKLGKLSFNEMIMGKAYMKVPIPPNCPVGFQAGDDIIASPRYWDGFGSDDLALIDLGGRHAATTETFSKLARFTGLKALNIGKTSFAPSDLQYLLPMRSLVSLTAAYCIKLSANDLLSLPILPNLSCLDITELKDASAIVRTANKLPKLRQLIAASCNLNDDDIAELSKSKSIMVLSLNYNTKVTDAGIAHLKNMKQLRWLSITGTGATPKCAEVLATLANLKVVENADARGNLNFEKFAALMKQKNPKIAVLQTEDEPGLTKVVMPEFPWQGPWLLSSKLLDEKEISREFEQKLKL